MMRRARYPTAGRKKEDQKVAALIKDVEGIFEDVEALGKETKTLDHDLKTLKDEVKRRFDDIVDTTVHKATFVWHPPHNLQIPLPGGKARTTQPLIVRCERATTDDVTSIWEGKAIPVTPGAVLWRWVGDNQIQINDIGGLVVGNRYDLVFSVVG